MTELEIAQIIAFFQTVLITTIQLGIPYAAGHWIGYRKGWQAGFEKKA